MPAPIRRPRLLSLAISASVATLGCAKPPEATDESNAEEGKAAAKRAPETKLPTALPEARPSPFEAEYRVRPADGRKSAMVKISEEGIRYSIGDLEHRVIAMWQIDAATLDGTYAALRAADFDRIETQPTRQMQQGGTSLSMLAGTDRHAASDMGRIFPKDLWADAYEAAAKAMEGLLPPAVAEDAAASLTVRWDASMAGHRATVDVTLGPDFAGLSTLDDSGANVRVGMSKQRPVSVELRYGPPAGQQSVELDPTKAAGVSIGWDAETDAPKLVVVDAEGAPVPGVTVSRSGDTPKEGDAQDGGEAPGDGASDGTPPAGKRTKATAAAPEAPAPAPAAGD